MLDELIQQTWNLFEVRDFGPSFKALDLESTSGESESIDVCIEVESAMPSGRSRACISALRQISRLSHVL
jgi:hypothetical protein